MLTLGDSSAVEALVLSHHADGRLCFFPLVRHRQAAHRQERGCKRRVRLDDIDGNTVKLRQDMIHATDDAAIREAVKDFVCDSACGLHAQFTSNARQVGRACLNFERRLRAAPQRSNPQPITTTSSLACAGQPIVAQTSSSSGNNGTYLGQSASTQTSGLANVAQMSGSISSGQSLSLQIPGQPAVVPVTNSAPSGQSSSSQSSTAAIVSPASATSISSQSDLLQSSGPPTASSEPSTPGCNAAVLPDRKDGWHGPSGAQSGQSGTSSPATKDIRPISSEIATAQSLKYGLASQGSGELMSDQCDPSCGNAGDFRAAGGAFSAQMSTNPVVQYKVVQQQRSQLSVVETNHARLSPQHDQSKQQLLTAPAAQDGTHQQSFVQPVLYHGVHQQWDFAAAPQCRSNIHQQPHTDQEAQYNVHQESFNAPMLQYGLDAGQYPNDILQARDDGTLSMPSTTLHGLPERVNGQSDWTGCPYPNRQSGLGHQQETLGLSDAEHVWDFHQHSHAVPQIEGGLHAHQQRSTESTVDDNVEYYPQFFAEAMPQYTSQFGEHLFPGSAEAHGGTCEQQENVPQQSQHAMPGAASFAADPPLISEEDMQLLQNYRSLSSADLDSFFDFDLGTPGNSGPNI